MSSPAFALRPKPMNVAPSSRRPEPSRARPAATASTGRVCQAPPTAAAEDLQREIVTMAGRDKASLQRAADCFGSAMVTDPTFTWVTGGRCPQRVVRVFTEVAAMCMHAAPDTSTTWVLQTAGPTTTTDTGASSSNSNNNSSGGGSSGAAPTAMSVCIAAEYPHSYPGTWTLLQNGLLRVLWACPDLRSVAVFGSMLTAFDAAKDRFKQANGPFLYIACFGTSPEFQGRGLGKELMTQVLAFADGKDVPAYLEANSADSAAFYKRQGFSVLQEMSAAPGAPTIYIMSRPRPSQRAAAAAAAAAV